MANYGPPGGPYPGSSPEPWPRQDRESADEYGQPADPWSGSDQLGGDDRWGGAPPSVTPAAPGSPAGHAYPAASGYPGSTPGYPEPGAGYPPHRRPDVGYGAPRHPGGPVSPPPGWTPREPEPMWGSSMADSTWSTPEPLPAPRRSVGRVVAMVAAALVVLAAGGVAVGFYLVGREKPTTPTVLPSTDPTKDGVPAEESPDPDLPTPSAPAAAPTTDARFVKTGQCVANEGTARRPVLVITECAPRTYEVLARFDEPTTGEEDAKAKCADVKNYTNYYFFNSDLDDLDFVLCLRQR